MVSTKPHILIDSEDKHILNYPFNVNKKSGYIVVSIKGKQDYLHRIITKTPKGLGTDHINGNKLDNRRQNLRVCSQQENTWNRCKAKNKTSKFKGVSFHKRSKLWRAYITYKKVMQELGYFRLEIDAAKKYNEAAKIRFGKFAKLNWYKEQI